MNSDPLHCHRSCFHLPTLFASIGDMLTPEERSRIKAEEEFRFEVRRSLETIPDSKHRILAFFNSALGIWVLSSILLGTISFLYKKWEQQQELQHRFSKLDTEVASRIDAVWMMVTNVSDQHGRELLQRVVAYAPLLFQANTNSDAFEGNAFPEYRERPLHSLLWELGNLVPEEQKSEINHAYTVVSKLKSLHKLSSDKMYYGHVTRQPDLEANIQRRLEQFDTFLRIPRWRRESPLPSQLPTWQRQTNDAYE